MIFVDTGAWFASVVPWDANHAATAWLSRNREPLLTTEFILDETLALPQVRDERRRALALGERILGGLATVQHVEANDVRLAWQVFRDFEDKSWSFTDCTCKVIIERLGLTTAFSFDRHFHQFGRLLVVP